MPGFQPVFTITNPIAADLTCIERARGFLEAHHTTHIEGTHLTLEHGSLTIQEFEGLCPDVNRRTLQRDLKNMIDSDLFVAERATNRLVYRLRRAL